MPTTLRNARAPGVGQKEEPSHPAARVLLPKEETRFFKFPP
jgi:hypothetical protein